MADLLTFLLRIYEFLIASYETMIAIGGAILIVFMLLGFMTELGEKLLRKVTSLFWWCVDALLRILPKSKP